MYFLSKKLTICFVWSYPTCVQQEVRKHCKQIPGYHIALAGKKGQKDITNTFTPNLK